MLDFTRTRLQPIPKPKGTATIDLEEIIGAEGVTEIAQAGAIEFHSTGDTGIGNDSPQEVVSDAMSADYNISNPAKSPAFMLHLGDVIYGGDKDRKYRDQFYDPYRHYPGKIIAIPGNHDGEVFPNSDPKTLRAFLANFCAAKASVPEVAGTIFREAMTQPGVYWLLNAPFLQIVGLYSNVAENPGFISGEIPGAHQKKWLTKILKQIKADRDNGNRKALLFAVHHPPFSSAGHSGSAEMLRDIDECCNDADLMPDVVLAAHSHTMQRYTRRLSFGGRDLEIPYVVCGCGGKGNKPVGAAHGEVNGDHSFDASYKGYGYLRVKVSSTKVEIRFIAVGVEADDKKVKDKVSVNLKTNKLG